MVRSPALRRAGLALLFLSVAVITLRPTRLDSFRGNLGDPALVTALVAWPGRALVTDPTRLFSAPFYWPNADTYAYSDVLLTQSGPWWLFYAVTGSWTAATIAVGLLSTVVAQIGAYLLTLRITGRRDAGIVAGAAFGGSAYALNHWGTLQLASFGMVALALVAFLRVIERPTPARGGVLGIATLATFYASLYYGALWILLLTLLSAAVLGRRLLTSRRGALPLLGSLTTAAAATLVGIAPTVRAFLRMQERTGFRRPLVRDYDLLPTDLVRTAEGSYLWRSVLRPPVPPVPHEHRFYPGVVVALLALAGTAWLVVRLARRRPLGGGLRARADLGVVLAAGVIAALLARGASGFGPLSPWVLARDVVPGLSGIRATSRLAVPALLAGAVLAGVGHAALARRWAGSGRRAVLLTGLLLAAVCLDLAAPGRWAPLDTSGSTLAPYRALRGRPAGAVLELPIVRTQDPAWPYVESPRMVYATLDWHPRVNGYSGSIPPTYSDELERFSRFPDDDAVRRLEEIGVRYVLLHVGSRNGQQALTEEEATAAIARLPPGARVERTGGTYVVTL